MTKDEMEKRIKALERAVHILIEQSTGRDVSIDQTELEEINDTLICNMEDDWIDDIYED